MQDFDMKSYSGEDIDPVAVDQVEHNSFADTEDYPVNEALLSEPAKTEEPLVVEKNPQAENFRALREEVEKMKSERDQERTQHQEEMRLLRANMAPKVERVPHQERKFLEGMREDDVPSVAELRKEWDQREAAYSSKLEELEVIQRYPDYQEVIEKHTLALVQQKPHLAEGIQGARNKALFAYELGKMHQQMQVHQQVQAAPPQTAPISNHAERIVANARKPGSIANASGQGALSKADYIGSMSDREFLDYANKHLDQI